MLALLGLSKTSAIVGLVLLVAIGGLYWHTGQQQDRIDTLNEDKGKLDMAVKTQTETIRAAKSNIQEWKKSFDTLQRQVDELAKVSREASTERRRLSDIFGKHDFTALTIAKPGLIERRINAGSRATIRVFGEITRGIDDVRKTGTTPAVSGTTGTVSN